jgi:DNA-directed RNA polymerase sigma subunit (sigma70/sigma32)
MKYLKAKWDHYIDSKLQHLEWTCAELDKQEKEAEAHDEWIRPRVEYMYNYLDYDSDRHRVRQRFLLHANRKSTIEDIGELLDRYVLDSKARSAEFW